MKNSSILIKLSSLVVSVVLIITFILPKFESIRAIQDDITSYQTQTQNVSEINAQLQALVTRVDSVSVADQTALLRFLPDEVDDITVLRTLQNITELSGVAVQDLAYSDSKVVEDRNLEAHTFEFGVTGTYEVIAEFLHLLEQNEYVFEFQEVEFSADPAGELTVGGSMSVHSLLVTEDGITTNDIN